MIGLALDYAAQGHEGVEARLAPPLAVQHDADGLRQLERAGDVQPFEGCAGLAQKALGALAQAVDHVAVVGRADDQHARRGAGNDRRLGEFGVDGAHSPLPRLAPPPGSAVSLTGR